MGTLVNYLRWRGDIRFKYSPLNLMDAVALGQISYFDLRNVYVQGQRQTLGELYDRQLEDMSFNSTSLDPKDDAEEFLRAVDASERFRSAQVLDYTDIYDPDDDVQFSAMTLRLDDRSTVVAFRGTDDSIAGWCENFMISFTETQSQKMARDYLAKVLKWHRNVYVCGHSKGGNLAMYAACHMDDRQLKKIRAIYLNDSPGLCEDVVSEEQVRRIDPITTMTLPSDSIVGRIFEPDLSNKNIIKSNTSGPMAHSGYSWMIEDNGFVREESFSTVSNVINDSLDKYLRNADLEQRKKLVDGIFDTIKEGGYERLSDFKENGFAELFGVFKKKLGDSISNIQPKEMIMNTVDETRELIINKVDDIKAKLKKNDVKDK
ncbi:MAG: DUF2974 domain-containing protein [Firmicutes bacterium]|nr:DUF2974 domain-containing protein [Bacillota bacterium]